MNEPIDDAKLAEMQKRCDSLERARCSSHVAAYDESIKRARESQADVPNLIAEVKRLRNENTAFKHAIEAVRALHYSQDCFGNDVCGGCDEPWPCDIAKVLGVDAVGF